MDLAMPLLNGWEATRQILKVAPSAKILVLSTYDSDDHVQQAIAAGAAAYLIKQTAAADLVKAIHEVRKGNAYFSPPIAERLREKTYQAESETNPAAPAANVELTVREAEVLQLIAEGFANKQIADKLELSIDTVCSHLKHVFDKLHVNSRTEAVVRYMASKRPQL